MKIIFLMMILTGTTSLSVMIDIYESIITAVKFGAVLFYYLIGVI